MTQTIVPAPSAPPAVVPPNVALVRARRFAGPRAALAKWLEGSPGRLRLVGILAVIAALLLAVGGGESLRLRSSALEDASKASGHLVLLQSVQTELQQADADATNSFLSYGLEPQAQRLDYVASIKQAASDLAVAAQNSPADASVLGAANAALTRYTGYIEDARATNRQGLQVGANYLTTASELLSSGVIPPLQTRATADQKSINAAYSRAAGAHWWLLFFAVIGLGGLVAAQYYLARHSRRYLNVPLVGATLVVLVAVLIGAAAMAFAQSHANSVRRGALARATQVSASRLAAFDAKSLESLTLVNQNTAATDADPAWSTAMATAKASLPAGYTTAAQALAAYAAQHVKINMSDVNGNRDDALAAAIATSTGSANAEFAIYAEQTAKAPQEQAREAASGIHHARIALLPAELLIVLAGLLAAAGAWRGVSLRLDEYR